MQDYFLCLEVICFIFVYTMVFDKEARIERAKSLFLSGFNCSQSVVGAFADIYGFTQEQAMRMSASFGGGIGAYATDVWSSMWNVYACRTGDWSYGPS